MICGHSIYSNQSIRRSPGRGSYCKCKRRSNLKGLNLNGSIRLFGNLEEKVQGDTGEIKHRGREVFRDYIPIVDDRVYELRPLDHAWRNGLMPTATAFSLRTPQALREIKPISRGGRGLFGIDLLRQNPNEDPV